jgi:hypothetical protein
MPTPQGAPAPRTAPAGSALSRVPKIYLFGAGAVGIGGLALYMRKKAAATNGQNSTSETSTTPQDEAEET